MPFTNVERDDRYAFELPYERATPGVSAMLRAKNEETNVAIVLPRILGLFDEVVFVDNGSTDATLATAVRVAAEHPHGDRLRLATYPFAVSRCGDDHWATPEDSVANLAYYYNWCLSRCSFDYVFKWDLDMIPIPGREHVLAEAFESIDHSADDLWSVRCQTIYRAPDSRWYAARNEINREPRLHPNKATVRYRKARMWETLQPDIDLGERDIGDRPCIYEMKDTTTDEFSHWTNTTDLTHRKQTEYRNFCAVRDGRIDPDEFDEIDPPVELSPATRSESSVP